MEEGLGTGRSAGGGLGFPSVKESAVDIASRVRLATSHLDACVG